MGKVDFRRLTKEEQHNLENEFIGMLGGLGLNRQGRKLLKDLLTRSEIVMLARRIRIARKLLTEDKPIDQISRELKAGITTVRSVDYWLNDKFDAYRDVIPPLLQKAQEKNKKLATKKGRQIPYDPYSMRGLRIRYPAHFGLLNMLLGDPREYEVELED